MAKILKTSTGKIIKTSTGKIVTSEGTAPWTPPSQEGENLTVTQVKTATQTGESLEIN